MRGWGKSSLFSESLRIYDVLRIGVSRKENRKSGRKCPGGARSISRKENRRTGRKSPGNSQQMVLTPGFELRLHWWEASTILTTAPTLLPYRKQLGSNTCINQIVDLKAGKNFIVLSELYDNKLQIILSYLVFWNRPFCCRYFRQCLLMLLASQMTQ